MILITAKLFMPFQDDDMKSIRDLISSAILDPEVKGGLRWPLGKAASGDKFAVVGVWHTVVKSYKNPSLRLKIRDADRFDFRASTGEASKEIIVMLKRVASKLQVYILLWVTDLLKPAEHNFCYLPFWGIIFIL